jgi:hypothetical protein
MIAVLGETYMQNPESTREKTDIALPPKDPRTTDSELKNA